MSTAELGIRSILHVDNPAEDEDAQPSQEEVLHLNGREATLQTFGQRAEQHQMDQPPQSSGHHERLCEEATARNRRSLSDHILTAACAMRRKSSRYRRQTPYSWIYHCFFYLFSFSLVKRHGRLDVVFQFLTNHLPDKRGILSSSYKSSSFSSIWAIKASKRRGIKDIFQQIRLM